MIDLRRRIMRVLSKKSEWNTHIYAEEIIVVPKLLVYMLGPALVLRTDDAINVIFACAIVPIDSYPENSQLTALEKVWCELARKVFEVPLQFAVLITVRIRESWK